MSKIAIIFWSGTGNTEAMANAILDGVRSAGADVSLFSVTDITADEAKCYDKLILGCPSMGSEVLEESAFEPFFSSLEGYLSGKSIALFGSFGWGDGQWMRDWVDRSVEAGALVHNGEGLIINEVPHSSDLESCRKFGSDFATR